MRGNNSQSNNMCTYKYIISIHFCLRNMEMYCLHLDNWHIPFPPRLLLFSLFSPLHLFLLLLWISFHFSTLHCICSFPSLKPPFLSPCLFCFFLVLVFFCTEGRHKWVWAASTALCPSVHQHSWQLQVHLPIRTPPPGGWQVLCWAGAAAELWKLLVWIPHVSVLSWAQLQPAALPQPGISKLPLLHSNHKRALQEP